MSSDAVKQPEESAVIKNPADVEEAKAAMRLFSASNQESDQVKALTVRERILKDDPAAWTAAADILEKEAKAALLPVRPGSGVGWRAPGDEQANEDHRFYGVKFFDIQLGYKDGSLFYSDPRESMSLGRHNFVGVGPEYGSHEYTDKAFDYAARQYEQVRAHLSEEYKRLKQSAS